MRTWVRAAAALLDDLPISLCTPFFGRQKPADEHFIGDDDSDEAPAQPFFCVVSTGSESSEIVVLII